MRYKSKQLLYDHKEMHRCCKRQEEVLLVDRTMFEKSLWKKLWTCHKTHHVTMVTRTFKKGRNLVTVVLRKAN